MTSESSLLFPWRRKEHHVHEVVTPHGAALHRDEVAGTLPATTVEAYVYMTAIAKVMIEKLMENGEKVALTAFIRGTE